MRTWIGGTRNRDQRPLPAPTMERLLRYLEVSGYPIGGGTIIRRTHQTEYPHTEKMGGLRNIALGSRDPRNVERTRQARHPHQGGDTDSQGAINSLDTDNWHERGRTKSRNPNRSTQKGYRSHHRKTDPNEHRTRRHKYYKDFPLDGEHKRTFFEHGSETQPQERRLVWLLEIFAATIHTAVFLCYLHML